MLQLLQDGAGLWRPLHPGTKLPCCCQSSLPQQGKCHLVATAVVEMDEDVAMEQMEGVHSYAVVGEVGSKLDWLRY